MNVGIVGLGLIGGSLAKAYKKTGEHTVLGVDKEKTVTDFAKMAGAIDGELDEEHFEMCIRDSNKSHCSVNFKD